MPADLQAECEGVARRAKLAARELALASTRAKNAWLQASADRLDATAGEVLAANAEDVRAGAESGLSAATLDRLRLTPDRLRGIADALRQVATLPDPVGEVREGSVRPNGLQVQKVSVPLGVVFFLYESRPNVTADAAALCVKSGNAVILRGGKEAARSNAALHRVLAGELPRHGLPADAVQLVTTPDRDAVGHLLKLSQFIDLCIPRGGESLIRRVAAEATMPVLKHYTGNCHVYVDASAEYAMAERVVVNGKCQRPGVCNATESLLIHHAVAADFLPRLAATLTANGVELLGCERTCELVPTATPATDADHATEFLDLVLSVRVVLSLEAATDHIARHGSGHTDAIVTADLSAARRFVARVDSAAVVVNASTRFNDGGELGLGAEIGISTDKFHARGPCGLRELTSYKWVIQGDGQVRG